MTTGPSQHLGNFMSKNKIYLQVNGWQKLNARRDQRKYHWFRFENDFFNDEDFFEYSHAEKLFWLYILCNQSKQQKEIVSISIDHAQKIGGFKPNEINGAIEKLSNSGIITRMSQTCDSDGTGMAQACDTTVQYSTVQNSTEQIHDRVADSKDPALDFDSLYAAYPKKMGKKKGLDALRRKIKSKKQFDGFLQAVNNYRRYCEANQVEAQYIKHFSTFVNCWEDWTESDNGQTDAFVGNIENLSLE